MNEPAGIRLVPGPLSEGPWSTTRLITRLLLPVRALASRLVAGFHERLEGRRRRSPP